MKNINVALEDDDWKFLDDFKKANKCKNLGLALKLLIRTQKEQLK